VNRSDILGAALGLIDGQRQADYGPVEDNFRRISVGVNLIAEEAMRTHGRVTKEHCALIMLWVKMARLLETIDHADSWIDICGYAALGGEMAMKGQDDGQAD
jgi:hypothetical protein